ncbi:MAG: hypothetical protein JO113_05655 [Candidatus Eremiobacteraeota bacterium]|nr:hypothetical protein [Candidatus Eremiobacteraeota bacterium]
MTNVLDPIPTWVIMLVSALLIFAMSEAGFRLGERRGKVPEGKDPSWLLEASAYTMLALLLGFSFSMALGRYDARRGTFLREANAIATAFLRAQLLDLKTRSTIQTDLRAYVGERLDFARADAAPQQRATADDNSAKLQRDMWSLAMRAAARDVHSTMVPLFVASLNDVINLSTEERAVLTNHIPDVVIVWLLLIALIASIMMGYGFGREGRRALVVKGVFAVMVSLVFGLVLDLDRPQRGIIRVNLSSMQRMQRMQQSIENATATSPAP